MKTTIGARQHLAVTIMLMLFVGCGTVPAQPANGQSREQNAHAILENTCVISRNVSRLVAFYEPILREKAKWSGEDYAEFATGVGCYRSFRTAPRRSTFPALR